MSNYPRVRFITKLDSGLGGAMEADEDSSSRGFSEVPKKAMEETHEGQVLDFQLMATGEKRHVDKIKAYAIVQTDGNKIKMANIDDLEVINKK